MVILASASPRRRELLAKIYKQFEVRPSSATEVVFFGRPGKTVKRNAYAKAVVTDVKDDDIVISADTVVYRCGSYYLKPKDLHDATRMLKELSGKKHYVYTGVCIANKSTYTTFFVKSTVSFKKLSEDEIASYVATNSPLDKAGAYGIQDGAVVKGYRGSYSNIMGLPVEKLKSKLDFLGLL